MRRTALIAALAAALMVAALPVNAAVHEITGSECNGKGGVVAPGQNPPSLTALQATGVIESIDPTAGDGDDTKITFDFDKPSSKFVAAPGGDFTIEDFFGTDMDLILSPGAPIPDPDFPAHANCKNTPIP